MCVNVIATQSSDIFETQCTLVVVDDSSYYNDRLGSKCDKVHTSLSLMHWSVDTGFQPRDNSFLTLKIGRGFQPMSQS